MSPKFQADLTSN